MKCSASANMIFNRANEDTEQGNPNIKIRNPKQIKIPRTKTTPANKVGKWRQELTTADQPSGLGFSFWVMRVCFGFRISIFEFQNWEAWEEMFTISGL